MRLNDIVKADCLAVAIATAPTIATANDAHHQQAGETNKNKEGQAGQESYQTL